MEEGHDQDGGRLSRSVVWERGLWSVSLGETRDPRQLMDWHGHRCRCWKTLLAQCLQDGRMRMFRDLGVPAKRSGHGAVYHLDQLL